MSGNRTHHNPTEFLTDAIPASNNNNVADLIPAFIQDQIRLWGFDAVQKMFDDGFEPIIVDGRVLWAK